MESQDLESATTGMEGLQVTEEAPEHTAAPSEAPEKATVTSSAPEQAAAPPKTSPSSSLAVEGSAEVYVKLRGPWMAITNSPSSEDNFLVANRIEFILKEGAELEKRGVIAVNVLMELRLAFDRMWPTKRAHASSILEVYALASRNESWRIPLGAAGYLGSASDILKARDDTYPANDVLVLLAIRLVGNLCADQDENRRRLIDCGGVPALVSTLLSPDYETYKLAIPALFNVCLDYESAQKIAFESRLSFHLIRFCGDNQHVSNPDMGVVFPIACQLLGLAPEDDELRICMPESAYLLLAATAHPSLDDDDRAVLISRAIRHLKLKEHRCHVIGIESGETRLFQLLDAFQGSRFLFKQADDPTDRVRFGRLAIELVNTIVEAVQNPEFAERFPKRGNVRAAWETHFRGYLTGEQPPMFQACCCLVLGDMARSDDISAYLVVNLRVQRQLVSILGESDHPQLLHAALELLRTLAVCAAAREPLGAAGAFQALARIWKSDQPDNVQATAAWAARTLLRDSTQNVERFLADMPVPALVPPTFTSPLMPLLDRADATDDADTKVQAGRVVAAVLRTVYADANLGADGAITRALWAAKGGGAARPLTALVEQEQFPALYTEGWMALALAARSAAGCRAVAPVLEREPVRAELKRLLAAPKAGAAERTDSPPQRADVENARVLMHELGKNMDKDWVGEHLGALMDSCGK